MHKHVIITDTDNSINDSITENHTICYKLFLSFLTLTFFCVHRFTLNVTITYKVGQNVK